MTAIKRPIPKYYETMIHEMRNMMQVALLKLSNRELMDLSKEFTKASREFTKVAREHLSIDGFKYCTRCDRIKNAKQFYDDPSAACRQCMSFYSRTHRDKKKRTALSLSKGVME